ncbi:hypothetical protein THAOC_19050, partial [Thalassiosira oceanica]
EPVEIAASPLGDVFMPNFMRKVCQFWPFPLSSAFANYDRTLRAWARSCKTRAWAAVTTYLLWCRAQTSGGNVHVGWVPCKNGQRNVVGTCCASRLELPVGACCGDDIEGGGVRCGAQVGEFGLRSVLERGQGLAGPLAKKEVAEDRADRISLMRPLALAQNILAAATKLAIQSDQTYLKQEGGHLLPGAPPTRVGSEGTAPAGGH